MVVTALGVLFALSWSYVLWLAATMDMGGMDMSGFRIVPALKEFMAPDNTPWSGVEFAYIFIMWAVMMVAMMTPSAAPMILIYAQVARQAAIANKPFGPVGFFAVAYLIVWVAFALIATVAQWALDRAALLDPNMETTSNLLGGVLLIAAGLYQWTRLKDVCLAKCQSPFLFIQQHGGFRHDIPGSLLLGMRHGAYCVGCCWVLMALLFVGGVMNVFWMAALAVLILLEKATPIGRLVGRLAGSGVLFIGLVWIALIAAPAKETPTVAVAASLRPALDAMTKSFEKTYGQTVRITYGATGKFVQQIEKGAPLQLLLAADDESVQKLAAENLTDSAPVIFAHGQLSLIASKDSPVAVDGEFKGLKEALASGKVEHFAIANPDMAPYGRAAREALQKEGLWDTIQPLLLIGEDVGEAAKFAANGAAQAGLIAYSLSISSELAPKLNSAIVSEGEHHPIDHGMAILKGTTPQARAFADFVYGPEGRKLLEASGFTVSTN